MNRTIRFYVAAFMAAMVIVVAPSVLFAKGGGVVMPRPTANFSQSREFYLTFTQNLHQTGDPQPDLDVFIASNYKTKGTIEILGPGTTTLWSAPFTVDSQSVTTIVLPPGLNKTAEIQDVNNEKPLRNAVHVIADNPIVVYGLNHIQYTADGFLTIPPSAWGTNYKIAAYYGITRTDEYPSIRATSEFALVSAYDSTNVNIVLSDNTMDGNGNMTHAKGTVVPVTLMKGQVYQMQALKVPGAYNDLSETIISSNRPVGVFAGAKCTDVPAPHPACDYIVEMLPPIDTWGKEYFTYPFEPSRTAGDLWRIFAIDDGTDVFLNGNNIGTISPSNPVSPFFETDNGQKPELKTAAHWTFSKPVLMVQYITGQTYDNSDHGDPSDVVLETREEFERGVVFANPPNSYGYTNYLNIFINDSAGNVTGLRDSLYLDGFPITKLPATGTYQLNSATPVPGTSFWVFHVTVPGGVHRLHAQSDFSAYAVGLKSYESYAWACALALKKIGLHDTVPPILPIQLTCGEEDNFLQDLPHDSTISGLGQLGDGYPGRDDSLNYVGWLHLSGIDSTYNFFDQVLTSPNLFVPGDTVAAVHIQVINLRQNAHGALNAIDLAGNDTIFYFDYIADTVTTVPFASSFGNVVAGSTKTDTIVITNPLNRPVKIDSFWLVKNTVFKIIKGFGPFPMTLAAGKSSQIIVKYTPLVDGFDQDSIQIKFDCFTRLLAVVLGGSGTPCDTAVDIDFGTLTLPSGGGAATSTLTTNITNNGTDTLIVTALSLSPGSLFSIVNPVVPLAAPLVITPGSSSTISIKFSSAVAGSSFLDSMKITSNAKCADPVKQIYVKAKVTAPGPQISGFDFGKVRVACDSSDYGFTLGNTGTSKDVLLSLVSVSGDAGDFNVILPTMPDTIVPNGKILIVATFTPKASGPRSNFWVATFQSGAIDTVELQGIGLIPQLASVDVNIPGSINVNSSADTFALGSFVAKQFSTGLIIDSVSISGPNASDFKLIGALPVITLGANGVDTVHIRFTPSGSGLRTATLTFHWKGSSTSCDSDVSLTIQLTGTGNVPAIYITQWDAQRVFKTTTRNGFVWVVNHSGSTVTVDSLWLSQGIHFALDMNNPLQKKLPWQLATEDSNQVFLTFTPADTVAYFDTVNAHNSSSSPLVNDGYITGVGKVVFYTASVPNGIHGSYGVVTPIQISVGANGLVGYTRPSAPGVNPGDPTPLDSGNVTAVHFILQVDPTVLTPKAADNTTISLTGALTSGATSVIRDAAQPAQVIFDVVCPPLIGNTGILATVNYRTLYAPTNGSPIIDTVTSSSPWVIWNLVPGLFILDSVCGLGSATKIIYIGGASLSQSIPNPVTAMNGHASVSIPFSLQRDMNVQMGMYNSMGSEVAHILDGPLAKGSYAVPVNVEQLPAGVYYYRLISEGAVQTRTMVIAR